MEAWLSGASYRANMCLWGSFEGTSEAKSVSIFGDLGPFCEAETITLLKTGHSGTEPAFAFAPFRGYKHDPGSSRTGQLTGH